MMPAPIVQIVWSHRRPFLFVMCLTFLALAFFIFMLPKRATVRSSIEIGSAVIGDKQEPFEPPEYVAKRIPSVYGPAALLAMANKGISPLILSALQNPTVESIGRSLVIVSVIDPSVEKEAKEFQKAIADIIIKELAPRARAFRESITARKFLAKRASDNLDQQIKDDTNEIERTSTLADGLQSQLEKQRAALSALYQRTGTAMQPGESAVVEAHIRELHEQISSQTNLIGRLALDRSDLTRNLETTRRRYEAQGKAVVDAQFEQDSFNETRISLPAALISAPTAATSSRFNLLLVAFAISLLTGFGTVVLFHNFFARKI
jgi:hypothetical protein